jgi:transposase-like protein
METKPPKFTEEQQAKLRANPNVKKVSGKTLQYTPEFKKYFLQAVREGQGANNVFKQAGIPIIWLRKDYVGDILRKWRKLAKEHGETHFDQEHRGRINQSEYRQMSDKEKVTHLEMKVEALEYVRRHFQLPPAIHWKPRHSGRRQNTK